jgi:hypothetical protein
VLGEWDCTWVYGYGGQTWYVAHEWSFSDDGTYTSTLVEEIDDAYRAYEWLPDDDLWTLWDVRHGYRWQPVGRSWIVLEALSEGTSFPLDLHVAAFGDAEIVLSTFGEPTFGGAIRCERASP